MKTENQLDFVRLALENVPRNEWAQVAGDAQLALRTLYKTMEPAGRPSYDTVYSLYSVLKARRPAKKARAQ